MRSKALGSRLARGLALAVAVGGLVDVAFAATYELTVDEGTTDLATALAAQYPGATLAENDTIVKKGLGELSDSETALAKECPLDVQVEEGVFHMNVSRQVSTWTVKAGASLRVGVSLQTLMRPEDYRTVTRFILAGDGTADYPGAIYFESNSGAWEQQQTFTLTDDAVIAFGPNTTGFNFSSRGHADTVLSVYYMNGHDLTFRECGTGSASKYVRFRYAVSFVDPGRLVLDGVWMTHLQTSNVFTKRSSGAYVKLPVVLKNGARINLSDDTLGTAIDSLTCEPGTTIGQFYDTTSKAAAIRALIGCPTITADQTITVKESYLARAADVAAGNRLTAEGDLVWAEGATCALAGTADGVGPSTPHVVATVAGTMTGTPAAGETALEPTRTCTLTTETDGATTLKVAFEDAAVAEDECVVFAEKGKTVAFSSWLGSLTDAEKAALAGKRLVKYGSGVFAVDGNVKDLGFRNLRVARGVYEVAKGNTDDLPVYGGKIDVTVEDGATLRMGVGFDTLNSLGKFVLTVAGAGAPDEGGAVVFTTQSGAATQTLKVVLTGDTVFAFPKSGSFNFSSNNDAGNVDSNCFVMNRHKLTFRRTGDYVPGDGNYVRFRYAVRFVDAGVLELDGVGLTRLSSGGVYVTATDGGATSLEVALKNGAKLNCVNTTFAGMLSNVTCEQGTTLGKLFTDTPGDYALARVTGCPTITADQTITVGKLVARAEDLANGRRLVAAGTLAWGAGSCCAVSGTDAAIRSGTPYVVAEATAMSGAPVGGDLVQEPLRICTVAATATQVSVAYEETDPPAEDEYPVFVESCTTFRLSDLLGDGKAALAGKKLVKYGLGTCLLDFSFDTLGATELVVRRGVCEAPASGVNYERTCPFPRQADGGATNLCVTVENGATLRTGARLDHIERYGNFILTAAGAGAEGQEGAVVFTAVSSTYVQKATFVLSDDAVFAFAAAGGFNFSNSDYAANTPEWNRFVMNRHRLTFRNCTGQDGSGTNYVRFRYTVNFVDPGTLELDGVWLTRHNWSVNGLTATDGGATTLAVDLVNGARLNCVTGSFSQHISDVVCEAGTSIGKVFDAPQDYALAKVTGCPAITADQVVTVNALSVRAADLESGHVLTAAGSLGLGADCAVSVDRLAGVTLPDEGVCFARAAGGFSAAPRRGVLSDDGVRAHAVRVAAVGGQELRLTPAKGIVLIVQ